jgi:hypothetical protein
MNILIWCLGMHAIFGSEVGHHANTKVTVSRKLKHFTCSLTARSKQHEEAIHAAAAQERDGIVKWT